MRQVLSLFGVFGLISFSAWAGPPYIECTGVAQRASVTAILEEGIDNYRLMVRGPSTIIGSILGQSLKFDSQPYSLEIDIPKLTGTKEIAPTCFFVPERPLVFSCTTGVVNGIAHLDHNGIVEERRIKELKIQAKHMQRVALDTFAENVEDSLEWHFEAQINGRKVAQEWLFPVNLCRNDPKAPAPKTEIRSPYQRHYELEEE